MEDQLNRAQILEILTSRAASYAFLSHVYKQEVTKAFLEGLIAELAGTLEEEPESGGHRLLREYLQRIAGEDLDQVETELSAEYAGLFLNASFRPVHPFESVYTSSDGLLMQRARDEVFAEYRAEGLGRTGEFKEPEDHIATELEFMSYLCQKSAEALEAGDTDTTLAYLQKQKGFLEKHLLVWGPRFCQDLARVTGSEFFLAMAGITAEHLSIEIETIDELLDTIES